MLIKGKILRVKQGYNPNSSSMGTIILTMPFAYLPAFSLIGITAGVIINRMVSDDHSGKSEEEKDDDK
jgi:hypothetical protein